MKTLTIILACLLSSSAMAQKKTLSDLNGVANAKDLNELSTKGTLTLSDSAYYHPIWTTGNSTGIFAYPPKPLTYVWMTEAKKAMEVTEKDSAGNIKVWIDPKRIVWTSDSTFVLKTK